MSENKELLEKTNSAELDNIEEEKDIEFIDYDIDKVKADKSNDKLDLEKPIAKVDVKSEILSYVKMIIIAVVAAFVINTFVIINATVPTGSMENTIMPGDRLIGFRMSYMFSEPERGDIVVFKYPLDEEKNYIKRIIGLPGETVIIENGKIQIKDTETGEVIIEELEEDYLKEDWTLKNNDIVFEVPEDRYLMMGDNRNFSSDARDWQMAVKNNPEVYTDEDIIYVHEDKILGKAMFTYWSNFKWLN